MSPAPVPRHRRVLTLSAPDGGIGARALFDWGRRDGNAIKHLLKSPVPQGIVLFSSFYKRNDPHRHRVGEGPKALVSPLRRPKTRNLRFDEVFAEKCVQQKAGQVAQKTRVLILQWLGLKSLDLAQQFGAVGRGRRFGQPS